MSSRLYRKIIIIEEADAFENGELHPEAKSIMNYLDANPGGSADFITESSKFYRIWEACECCDGLSADDRIRHMTGGCNKCKDHPGRKAGTAGDWKISTWRNPIKW